MASIDEVLYRLAVCNPTLNPFGCWYHVVRPQCTQLTKFDSPLLKFMERNVNKNKTFEPIMEGHRVSSVEEIKEFYRRGGKGLRFDLQ